MDGGHGGHMEQVIVKKYGCWISIIRLVILYGVVKELIVVKKQLQETLHKTLFLGWFNFCSCCKILICLVCLLLVLSCLLCNCCRLTVCIVVVFLRVLLSYLYLLYCVGIAFFTLDAGVLARSQYSEGPATGHLDTGFSLFHCAQKQMLR